MWMLLHVVLLVSIAGFALAEVEAEEAEDKQPVESETVDVKLPEQQVEEKVNTDKRSSDRNFCFMGGRGYQHGEIFPGHTPCSKYRCEYGYPNLIQEGCYLGQTGECIPINGVGLYQCQQFRCTKTSSGSYYYYNFTPVGGPGCIDYHGRCRQPGDVFPYVINGRFYTNCVCYRAGGRQLQYQCHSNYKVAASQ